MWDREKCKECTKETPRNLCSQFSSEEGELWWPLGMSDGVAHYPREWQTHLQGSLFLKSVFPFSQRCQYFTRPSPAARSHFDSCLSFFLFIYESFKSGNVCHFYPFLFILINIIPSRDPITSYPDHWSDLHSVLLPPSKFNCIHPAP